MKATRWMTVAIAGSMLAATGVARAQDDPTRLTDDQRARMREWLDAREALRGGERPSDARRRELPDWVDADDRLVLEWRDAREEARESRSVSTPRRAPRSRTRDPMDDLPDPPPAWRDPLPPPPSSVPVQPPPRVPDDTEARRAVLAIVLETLRDVWPMLVEHYDETGDGVLTENEVNALRAALDVHLRRFAHPVP